MGTDLVLFAERRVERAWQPIPEPQLRDVTVDGKLQRHCVPSCALTDIGRPYALFSLLAGGNVGLGDEVEEWSAQFRPRGFPDDMNPLYQQDLPRWYRPFDQDGSDWGATWREGRELLELDLDLPLRRTAYVDRQYADLFHPDQPFPARYPRDLDLYHGLFRSPPAGTERVQWSVPLRDYARGLQPLLKELSALAPLPELRIIYWFNS